MSRLTRGLVAALVPVVVPVALQAQLKTPAEWRWVTDAPATLVEEQDLPDGGWRFVAMPPGWHITMGPGGFLYHPAYTASGRFALEAEVFLFPEKSDEEYGLFAGGRDLASGAAEYVAFVARTDGSGAVVRHAGGATTLLAPWTVRESVLPQQPGGTAKNVFRIAVEGDSVFFDVNGGRVASLPRSVAQLDGHFGFRVGAGVNLHISTLDFTQRIAPPRR